MRLIQLIKMLFNPNSESFVYAIDHIQFLGKGITFQAMSDVV